MLVENNLGSFFFSQIAGGALHIHKLDFTEDPFFLDLAQTHFSLSMTFRISQTTSNLFQILSLNPQV